MHERNYTEHLKKAGYSAVEIYGVGITEALAQQTLHAMKSGAEIIIQGALLHGSWSGRADILRRVNSPSGFGDWSYEVLDTKLARETKAATVLQLSLYSDLLSEAQGSVPEYMHVVAPGSELTPQTFRTTAFAAYYRRVRQSLERSILLPPQATSYPDPKNHCDICRWRTECDSRRRADDHLCLVAGITKVQVAELKRHEVATVAQLAALPLPLAWKPERGAGQSYERCREQARVQLEGRLQNKPVHEVLSLVPDIGLHCLPAPSPGDVFFDIEGDPFVGEGGLEYLFGYVYRDAGGEEHYIEDWALDREAERQVFHRFVAFVMGRWAEYPDLHIYHYAPYEPGALKRLMGRYAICEDDIDRMLRAGLFVDLYTITKQTLRASVESYTIKNLEPFYKYRRSVALLDARHALAVLQARIELNDPPSSVEHAASNIKRTIAGYNRDDCLSACELRTWLEQIRDNLMEQGASLPRPAADSPEPSEELGERQRRVAELVTRLTHDVPADAAIRTPEQHARWVLAHTLDWHRREQKPVWWERFRLAALAPDELRDERAGLAGLLYQGNAGGTSKAPIHRYTFPAQDVELRGEEKLYMAGGDDLGELADISIAHRTIDIKKRVKTALIHPDSLFGIRQVSPGVLPDALLRIGEYVAENAITGDGQYRAARDLLLRRPPRIEESLLLSNEAASEAAVRVASRLGGGVLAIQGPPGAGKTHTAARMICALVKCGKRVGITANSHKVIRNLLDKVVEAAEATRLPLQCIQKLTDKSGDIPGIQFSTDNEEALDRLRSSSCQVGAGTAWLWAREDAFEAVDVLFVDEAAQMSLANVVAVSQACKTLVLLGDPQQLEQPMQGSHPEGTDVSALDHLLQGSATIDPDKGLFLEETWRLHPDICTFTSELFYEGRLRSRAGLDQQTIKSSSRVNGTGLRFLPVHHAGNQNSSPEEALEIKRLVSELLNDEVVWIDPAGAERILTLNDILIVAPYNAQVFEIQKHLPGSRVGTVDKFQGQEAPIVIYSMTTSTHTDAPRGMNFVYNLNRFNVATSRARCICILVACPQLFEPECNTPAQMQMANAFCRYLELAKTI